MVGADAPVPPALSRKAQPVFDDSDVVDSSMVWLRHADVSGACGPSRSRLAVLVLTLLVPLGLALFSGCGLLFETGDCARLGEPAISVEVIDARTRQPVSGAHVVARDGSFTDTTVTDEDGKVGVAGDRPGTYQVTVQREGYVTLTRDGVKAPRGPCGPRTVELTVELVPTDS